MSCKYLLKFNVAGTTRLEAVTAAVGLLRTELHLTNVYRIDELAGGRWTVVLNVWEDC